MTVAPISAPGLAHLVAARREVELAHATASTVTPTTPAVDGGVAWLVLDGRATAARRELGRALTLEGPSTSRESTRRALHELSAFQAQVRAVHPPWDGLVRAPASDAVRGAVDHLERAAGWLDDAERTGRRPALDDRWEPGHDALRGARGARPAVAAPEVVTAFEAALALRDAAERPLPTGAGARRDALIDVAEGAAVLHDALPTSLRRLRPLPVRVDDVPTVGRARRTLRDAALLLSNEADTDHPVGDGRFLGGVPSFIAADTLRSSRRVAPAQLVVRTGEVAHALAVVLAAHPA